MEVQDVAVGELIPYASNSRTHSEEQIAQIAASIKEFGFNNPILLDGDKGVIAGHGRLLAARKLEMDKVPTIELAHLSETKKKAYILADNKLALNAGWDMDLLSLEMGGLQDEGFDLSLIGFDDDELANIFTEAHEGLTDPDAVPDTPDDPVTREGDVWLLGKHRLMCGDSTVATSVETLLGDVEPHLMVTDPPYGVDFDPTWRKGSEKRTYIEPGQDKEWVWKEAWELFPGDVIYIWHGANKAALLYNALDELGFDFRAQIIWNKMRFIIGRGHYCWNHEPCFYGVRKNKTAHWAGARNQATVWDIKHRASDTNHGAQKPVECMKRPIENSSSPGQAVYEPFSGSGTTIIAGEMTGRAMYAMEIHPAYCDVAVNRWQDFTGEQAQLEGSGEIFPTIKENAT